MVLFVPIRDTTAGFKCYKRRVLERIRFDEIKFVGYAFQIEMNFKAYTKGFKIVEHPIIFADRAVGVSKMSRKIVYEAVFMVWKLKLRKLLGRL